MEAVITLLLMLLRGCHGVQTYCDGRQDGAQCFGALGGTVVLRLMDSASEIFRYTLEKDKNIILRGRKMVISVTESRFSFTPDNGTFWINDLSRTDGGEYTLDIFKDNSGKGQERTLHLTIQAPVSSVLLDSECLSQGEMRVSCSSEGGDSPQYSWTLDGRPLTDAQLLCGNTESNNITLRQHVSGQLICSVSNHVNSVSKQENISTCGFIFIDCIDNGTHISQWVYEANNTLCPELTTASPTTEGEESGSTVSNTPSTNNTSSNQTETSPISEEWYIQYLPIMLGVLGVLVILLLAGVGVVWAHKKTQNKNNKEGQEDEQEMTYADVRIVQRQVRHVQRREDVEVEYGQIKFSERPRQPAKQEENDCVYAKVRKGV